MLPFLLLLALLLTPATGAHAITLPSGFQQTTAFSGLTQPTGVQFASDGRVFIAEKSGLIKVYDSLSDTTPTTFADLRTNTHNFWDRGLLGMVLHPNFPTTPYVYVLYTLDAVVGGTPPRWGAPGGTSDGCPNPPGDTADGCVVAGRVSRLTAMGNLMVGSEQIFIENYCQQYPSHSIGTIDFGGDGALYVSGGDGASFNFVDYGQKGWPSKNPCGDPPGTVGSTLSPPTAEGGALRSQDLLSSGDAVTFDGTVLRLDPVTGGPMPDNPLVGGTTVADDPIIAYGLRNPFRMAARPGTNEMWVGDVGWNEWEEVNRVAHTGDIPIENFGWPCYEGIGKQPSYQSTGLNLCTGLYGAPGTVTDPYYAYKHSDKVVPDEVCGTGSSSVTGLAFYGTGSYPTSYEGALFFADYARNCIWAMPLGPDGEPDPSGRFTFGSAASTPVDLKIGPNGDLFYVDISGGNVYRIRYVAGTEPPVAVIDVDKTNGPTPLVVQFDGSGSSDPDPGDVLAYSWDLDGNGTFGDSTAVAPSRTYSSAGTYKPKLRVTDPHGATSIATVTITAGNSSPTATILTPSGSTTWHAGSVISFSGSATDPQQGTLGSSALSWMLVLHHCPANCHEHTVQTFTGATGSFTAPEHEYPTHLELRLTATDAGGLTDTKSVFLYPETVDLTFATDPPGLTLAAGPEANLTPFVRTEIVGAAVSISAPSPQTLNGNTYAFVSWSDDGARSHEIVAPATDTSYVALFECVDCANATPTPTAIATPSRTATRTATPTVVITPTTTRTATPTVVTTPTTTRTPTPTRTATPTPTVSRTATPLGTATATFTAAPTTTPVATTTVLATTTAVPATATPAGPVPTPTTTAGSGTCAAPIVLPGAGGVFIGTTSGGSTLAGTCASSSAAPETVFAWTPVATGQAVISTCGAGTSFDTVMYIRSGTCGGGEAFCNDDFSFCSTGEPSQHHGSLVSTFVTAGQTYLIVVDGYGSGSGAFSLTIEAPEGSGPTATAAPTTTPLATTTPAPTVTLAPTATVVPTTTAVPTFTVIPTTTALPTTTPVPTTTAVPTFTVVPTTTALPTTTPVPTTTAVPTFTVVPTTTPLRTTTPVPTTTAVPTFTVVPTMTPLRTTTPVPTTTAVPTFTVVPTTTALPTTTPVPTTTAIPTFTAVPTTTPLRTTTPVPTTTPIATTTLPAPTPTSAPGSGTCAAPIVLPAAGGVFSGTTSGGSALAGTCASTGNAPETVFAWTPATSGQVLISTCGPATSFDTVMYIRNGSCGTSDAFCNDDFSFCSTGEPSQHHGSLVSTFVTAGQTYLIVVDGYGSGAGTFTLTIDPQP